MKYCFFFIVTLVILGVESCNSHHISQVDRILQTDFDSIRNHFQTTIDGKPVDLYRLKNENGLEVWITNYGARIVSIFTPDRKRNFDNVVLGFSSLDRYLKDKNYMGAIVGRYANEKFQIDDQEFTLVKNKGKNSQNGETKGFDKVVWNVEKKVVRLN